MRAPLLALLFAVSSEAAAQPAPPSPPASQPPAPAAAPAPQPPPTPALALPPSTAGTTTYGADKVRFDLPIGPQAPPPGGGLREEPMVRRGMYDRPYLMRLGSGSTDVALGGYFELIGSYLQRQGISAGFTGEARRFNIFITSKIADRIRLTSELEFGHGTSEIDFETAVVDIMLHHALNLRGGIVLVPIGKFNIAHDSPLYDVVDRPLVSTRIIPATLSEVGGGLFGTLYPGGHKLTYEAYVVNGLRDGVIGPGGTRLDGGKEAGRFEKDNNGQPAVTGRLGYASPPRRYLQLETALSYYGGAYNTFAADGIQLDDPRWLHLLAWDLEAVVGPVTVRGELAYARIDLPAGLPEIYGHEQLGFYTEVVGTIFKRRLLLFQRASLAAVARLDYVDLNRDTRQSGEAMGDETWRLTVGLSLRPAPTTSLRIGYYHEWATDPLNNALRGGGVQLGIASYF